MVYRRWAIALGLFSALWLFTPPRVPLCGFLWLTGHPCPFCGMTRAMFALAKGHLVEAVHWNALAPLGFAMVFGAILSRKIDPRIWTGCAAAFAVYGVVRNL
jgi:hypothetical protein